MTDHDLHRQLAAMQSTLSHLQRQMDTAERHRAETSETLTKFLERLVTIEVSERGVPAMKAQVDQNALDNAVQDAVRQERAAVIAETRNMIFRGIAAAGALSSIAAITVNWLIGGSP